MKVAISVALVIAIILTFTLGPISQPVDAVAGSLIVGSVIAVMAISGISLVAAGITSSQLEGWVQDKLESWAAFRSSTVEQLIDSSLIGVTLSGLLAVGTAAAQGINDFIGWLRSDMSLSDYSDKEIISADTTINGYKVLKCPFNAYGIICTGDASYCYFARSNYLYPIPLFYNDTDSAKGMDATFTSENGSFETFSIHDYVGAHSYHSNWGVSYINGNYPMDPSLLHGVDVVYRQPLDIIDGEGSLSLKTGTIAVQQIDTDDKYFLDVGAEAGSTAAEVTDGVIADTLEGTLTVSGEVATEEPEFIITGPVSVSGLDDIFPFCIPFDLYHFFEALAADPVAPYFEWHFTVPQLNIDQVIAIDLSAFNTVAQILRTMELLLFAVGLAFETRKLLRS